MSRRRVLAIVPLCVAALLAGWFLRRALAPPPAPSPLPAPVTALLAEEEPGGFARATVPRPFRFPDDHGPHPEFRHEWWYFTGNLLGPGGRRFGYQLTFFRFALSPDPPAGVSRWATNQAYMAHFAITDAQGNRFRHFERTGRGALGLAGANAHPFRVWLDDWSAEGSRTSTLPVRLRATEDEASVDLVLDTTRPIVLQGDRGLSRKSAASGNASYYYSWTRLATRGSVRIDGVSFPVEGNSWLDREWGTSSLEKGQAGWDWFALQLSDGRDLMFYRLRRGYGVTDPFSAGTLVLPDGSVRTLSPDDVRIEILGFWRSPESGSRYPSRWRMLVPSEGLELEVLPRMADQELRTSVRYWEGAVGVRGSSRGEPVLGEGYVELTGYGETEQGTGGNGKFAPCPDTPNCVSSQDDNPEQRVNPILFPGDAASAWSRLRKVIAAMKGARVTEEKAGYLHAEFRSALFGFVDDVEFRMDGPGRIDVRSASRTGYYDFCVNRRRVEEIRARFSREP